MHAITLTFHMLQAVEAQWPSAITYLITAELVNLSMFSGWQFTMHVYWLSQVMTSSCCLIVGRSLNFILKHIEYK